MELGVLRKTLVIAVGGTAYLCTLLGVAWLSQATGCADADAVAAGCHAWLIANPFWSSYWSNLTSTIAGVALGLPIALYLDRKAGEKQQDFEHRAELRRRAAILEMLRRNIEAIELSAADIRNMFRQSSIPRTSVSTDAWNALSSDVLTILARYGDSAIETAVKLDAFFQLVKRTQGEADRLAVDVRRRLLTNPLKAFQIDTAVLDSSCAQVESLVPALLEDIAAIQSRLYDRGEEESAVPAVTPSTTGVTIKTP